MVGNSSKADVAECGDSNTLSFDVVFDLLANQRRQHALTCLIDHRQAIALTDLAEDVAVRENEESLTEIPNETVRTISTSLYHAHIPKLVDAGAVEYDQDHDMVQASETTEPVEQVLSLVTDGEKER